MYLFQFFSSPKKYLKNLLAEKPRNLIFAIQFMIGLWCNGSTTDFDSVSLGSKPGNPTKKPSTKWKAFYFFYHRREFFNDVFNAIILSFYQFCNYLTNTTTGHLYMQHGSQRGCNIRHISFPVGFAGLYAPSKKYTGNMRIVRVP
jgi:hypothetical protein